MANEFDDIVIEGIRRKRPTLDILARLLNVEITQGSINQTLGRIKRAKFPQQRTFAERRHLASKLQNKAIKYDFGTYWIE